MDCLKCHLQGINGDLLADIVMSGLDGIDLASLACTSSDLRCTARDQSLWKHLCHSTWPSTALEAATHLISSSVIGGFRKFYSDSYPLVLYDEANSINPNSSKLPNPSDFVSMVDAFFKDKCVLSKILDGIPEAIDVLEPNIAANNWGITTSERQRWFLDSPFKLELLDLEDDDEDNDLGYDNNGGYDHDRDNIVHNYNGRLAPQSSSFPEDLRLAEDHCKELMEHLRLSWVLLDKKAGRAVNLSSWKPLLVQRSWNHREHFVVQFGCVVPVEESVLPHKLARCTITSRFKMVETEACLQWREISMSIENITGRHIDGKKSLIILNQALYSFRSTNQLKVEMGYREFQKQRTEMIKRQKFKETVTDMLYISVAIALTSAFCYVLSLLF